MSLLHAAELVDYLKSAGQLDEAAVHLAELVNDEKFVSSKGMCA